GRPLVDDAGDDRTRRTVEPEPIGDIRRQALQPRTEPGTPDGLDAGLRAVDDDAYHRRANGEADADAAAGARIDRGVDPDDAALHVDQGAARIAGIDRRIGLDEGLRIADADLRARQRRDDALRHRLADAEGVAHREHDVADLEL